MTPLKAHILLQIARCGLLTTRQVVRITGWGKSGVYKHLAAIKNHKLIQPFSVPHSDLAPPDHPTPGMSATGENIYVATKLGIKWLLDAGYIAAESDVPIPSVPTRGLFMAHQVLIQDVRVWIELCIQIHGGELLEWRDGDKAYFSMVRPDAWFVYKLPSGGALVGMLEADRGTMRGLGRMAEKARSYAKLLGSDELAEATNNQRNFRLVVVTPDEARRKRVAAEMGVEGIADRVFVTTLPDIAEAGLSRPVWQTPGRSDLVPLVPESVLHTG